MSIQFWSCCGTNYVPGVKMCKKCGHTKPVYGVKAPDVQKPAKTPKKPTAAKETPKKRKPRQSRDPHISYDEEKLWVSTLRMANETKTEKD